jgi:hypothetical protein
VELARQMKPATTENQKRTSERRTVMLPGRLMWKDGRGATRFTSVVTRDVSDNGVFVQCESGAAIPLRRLVHFQLERDARDNRDLPISLRQGKVLSAVYRVGKFRASTGTPEGYALRLLVEPTLCASTMMEITANRSIA